MENSIRMLKQIESTHVGSGIPILFANLCVLAKISCLFLGEKATGKGTTVRSVKPVNILPQYDMNIDTMTLLILYNKIKVAMNQTFLWRVKEWSTLSQYHRHLFLTVGSQVITDHNYEHMTGREIDKPIKFKITNCNLIALIAITPLKFQRMITENENWESLASDRFIKLIMINPNNTVTQTGDPTYELPKVDLSYRKLPINCELKLIEKDFHKQLTPQRLQLTMYELLNAYCIFEGYESIEMKAQIEFHKLFGAILKLYPDLIYSYDIDEPDQFAIGALRLLLYVARNEGCDIDELVDNFSVYDKEKHSDRYDQTIMKHSNILTQRNLLNIVQNSPKRFYLSQYLQDYFSYIRSLTN